jgi:hypothetical protein
VFLGDTNLKRAAANPEGFGNHQNDLVVSIREGTLGDAEDYFSNTRIHTLRNTNNIVLLGYGADNLYSELLGGMKVAASPSMKFLQDYGVQIDLLHNNFPNAQILSSDPVPRRKSGFCNSAIDCFGSRIHPRFPAHHHLNFAKRYYLQRGRVVHKDLYDTAGQNLIDEEAKILIKNAYDALVLLKIEPTPPKNTYLGQKGFTVET